MSDEFNFQEQQYDAPPSEYLPWCQIINPKNGIEGLKPYGLALKVENAEVANCSLSELSEQPFWEVVEYQFSGGDVELLCITRKPRIVIVRRGPTCIKERSTGKIIGSLQKHISEFQENRANFKVFTRCLLFLVDTQKKLLHDRPLQLTLNGAAGVKFSSAFRKGYPGQKISGFTAEFEKAYAEFGDRPLVPKGELFHAHGIFAPTLAPIVAGAAPNTSLVTGVENYEHPTAANFPEFAIAPNSPDAKIIRQTFDEYKNFGQHLEEKVKEAAVLESYDLEGQEYEILSNSF